MKWTMEPSQKTGNITMLYIYDDVSAFGEFNWNTWEYEESQTSAKYFRDELQKIPETGEIELHINSNGGSVKEGTAIYNILMQHEAKKTGYVDGVAHSVAFLIIQACERRIMGLGTTALIHNMWMTCQGNSTQLRKYADDLDTMMEANRKVFLNRATITEEKLMELMEAETYLTPETALEYGLIDEIAGEADQGAIQKLTNARIMQLQKELLNQKSLKEEVLELEKGIMRQQTEVKRQQKKTAKLEDKENKLLNMLTGISQKRG